VVRRFGNNEHTRTIRKEAPGSSRDTPPPPQHDSPLPPCSGPGAAPAARRSALTERRRSCSAAIVRRRCPSSSWDPRRLNIWTHGHPCLRSGSKGALSPLHDLDFLREKNNIIPTHPYTPNATEYRIITYYRYANTGWRRRGLHLVDINSPWLTRLGRLIVILIVPKIFGMRLTDDEKAKELACFGRCKIIQKTRKMQKTRPAIHE